MANEKKLEAITIIRGCRGPKGSLARGQVLKVGSDIDVDTARSLIGIGKAQAGAQKLADVVDAEKAEKPEK